MADNIVTNANDVEIVIERLADGTKAGTAQALGRMIVDDFSLTAEEDDSLVSGVGFQVPAGISNGDITYSWSWTMMGSDTNVMEIISDSNGKSLPFSLVARKVNEDGTVEWERSLGFCKRTSEEDSLSSGDPSELSVEGIGFRYDRVI